MVVAFSWVCFDLAVVLSWQAFKGVFHNDVLPEVFVAIHACSKQLLSPWNSLRNLFPKVLVGFCLFSKGVVSKLKILVVLLHLFENFLVLHHLFLPFSILYQVLLVVLKELTIFKLLLPNLVIFGVRYTVIHFFDLVVSLNSGLD